MRRLRLLLGTALFACAGVRAATYPLDFDYLEKAELSSAMRTLAESAVAVEAELRGVAAPDLSARARIVAALERMLSSARTLETQRPTNHPLLDANITAFTRDVEAAKAAATADPPSFFLAGSVSGACRYCHRR